MERVLELSAEQVASPRHQGKPVGEVDWHGTQEGRVTLSTQKIGVRKPRLRKRYGGKGAEVPIPVYEAVQSDRGLRERLAAVMLRGGQYAQLALPCLRLRGGHSPDGRGLRHQTIECQSGVHRGR